VVIAKALCCADPKMINDDLSFHLMAVSVPWWRETCWGASTSQVLS
jgi:hypothetical protein